MKKSLHYKDLLGFIVDLITLGIYMASGIFLIIPYVKGYISQPFLLITLALILIFTTVRLLKYVITNILFEIEYITHDLNKKSIIESNTKLHHFDKIVPSTRMLNLINIELFQQYKKWSNDILSNGSSLWIRVNNKNINYRLHNYFYSPTKKVQILNINETMKKPTKNIIEESDMSHEEERRVEKPFFKKKYWRKAVLDSLSMIESEIIGRPFSMDLHDAGDDFHIFINPDYGNNVGKSFSFFLEKNSLFYKNEAIKKYK